MASAASQHTIHIKRADLASTFVPVQAPAGQQISILRDWYAREEKLDPKTIAFHDLTNEEATAVDKKALTGSSARKGREMGFLETWTKPTNVLAYGEPAGESPVCESSLLPFRLLPLLSTATHFIRSLLFALL